MTEKEIREIFAKHYKGGDLKRELISCLDEISLGIALEIMKPEGKPKEILESILVTKNRIQLFLGIKKQEVSMPTYYIEYIDIIRESMILILTHVRENYNKTYPVFRQQFDKEMLKIVVSEISQVKKTDSAKDERELGQNEMFVYESLLSSCMVALFGEEVYEKYVKEFHSSAVFLRECQVEAHFLNRFNPKNKKVH